MASDTEHCGQKQMRCAADFCRGLMPTVCANMYTATDFCPLSSSRLQRRQNRFSKRSFRWPRSAEQKYRLLSPAGLQSGKYVGRFLPRQNKTRLIPFARVVEDAPQRRIKLCSSQVSRHRAPWQR